MLTTLKHNVTVHCEKCFADSTSYSGTSWRLNFTLLRVSHAQSTFTNHRQSRTPSLFIILVLGFPFLSQKFTLKLVLVSNTILILYSLVGLKAIVKNVNEIFDKIIDNDPELFKPSHLSSSRI